MFNNISKKQQWFDEDGSSWLPTCWRWRWWGAGGDIIIFIWNKGVIDTYTHLSLNSISSHTQHAFSQSNMNFKFTMNPLINKRWNAGNVCTCFYKHEMNRMLQLCIHVWGWSAIRVFFARQKQYVYNHMLIWWPMKQHTCGWKKVWGYILASVKPMSIILQYTKKLLQKIHFVATGTDLIFSNLSALKYLKKPHH